MFFFKPIHLVASLCLTGFLFTLGCGPAPAPDGKAFIQWVREQALEMKNPDSGLSPENLSTLPEAIGASFGKGSYSADLPPGEKTFRMQSTEVMDGALARAGIETFLLDFRTVKAESPAARWLQQPREWVAQDAQAMLVPAKAFDLVYFVNTINRSQPSVLALRRFQSVK
jgi:hypothetical protein